MRKSDPGDRDLYRRYVTASDLARFEVRVKESDLLVLAERDLAEEVRALLLTHRDRLERYLAAHEDFRVSLRPVEAAAGAPSIVRRMAAAGRAAGVGPMAAVAGAVSEEIALGLEGVAAELIIENGGDLFLRSRKERTVGIYTGERDLDLALGLLVRPEDMPLGICTSSGRIGHSLSFGEASAATVLAETSALADAAATAVANSIRGREGVARGLATAGEIPGVRGAVVVQGRAVGAWGRVELVPLPPRPGSILSAQGPRGER